MKPVITILVLVAAFVAVGSARAASEAAWSADAKVLNELLTSLAAQSPSEASEEKS